MGNTWEVHAWVKSAEGGYRYVETWRGQSLLGMIRAARKAKREGAGCVKVEWR